MVFAPRPASLDVWAANGWIHACPASRLAPVGLRALQVTADLMRLLVARATTTRPRTLPVDLLALGLSVVQFRVFLVMVQAAWVWV